MYSAFAVQYTNMSSPKIQFTAPTDMAFLDHEQHNIIQLQLLQSDYVRNKKGANHLLPQPHSSLQWFDQPHHRVTVIFYAWGQTHCISV